MKDFRGRTPSKLEILKKENQTIFNQNLGKTDLPKMNMTEETKKSLNDAIDCLMSVRTGEDFEVECYEVAEKLYESFKDDLEDLWGFDSE